jgi:hypothetical protein
MHERGDWQGLNALASSVALERLISIATKKVDLADPRLRSPSTALSISRRAFASVSPRLRTPNTSWW